MWLSPTATRLAAAAFLGARRRHGAGLSTLADDVLGLASALGHERFHLVGHDWGAAVTWWLAARSPERLLRVAVVNVPHPAALAANLRSNPRQMAKSWYMGAFQLPVLPEQVLGGPLADRFARALARTATPGALGPEYLADLRAAWGQPGAATGMLNWYRAAVRHRGRLPDPRVHVPILILWGARDVALLPDLARNSLRMCDEGHLVMFDEATHWLLHDEPEEACALLLDWVAGRALAEG